MATGLGEVAQPVGAAESYARVGGEAFIRCQDSSRTFFLVCDGRLSRHFSVKRISLIEATKVNLDHIWNIRREYRYLMLGLKS